MLKSFFETSAISLERVSAFFEKYFWSGIINDSAYNWIDTTVYALLFVGFVWLLYGRFFKARKIEINAQFMAALSGWIVFGSALRASEDAEIYKTWLLVTPFFYITAFVISFSILLICLKFNSKSPYWKCWGASGYALGILSLLRLPISNISGIFWVACVWALWIAIFLACMRLAPKFFTKWNAAVLSAQMLDASSTFVALTFFSNFWEKHILGSTLMLFFEQRNLLLISGSASWIMFALKLLVVPAVLYAVDKYSETESEKKFVKMIVFMLGAAVGLRNTLEIGMFG